MEALHVPFGRARVRIHIVDDDFVRAEQTVRLFGETVRNWVKLRPQAAQQLTEAFQRAAVSRQRSRRAGSSNGSAVSGATRPRSMLTKPRGSPGWC